jgi:hypothetical protein
MLPSADLQVFRIEQVDGFQTAPPFFWHTAAGHWDQESGSAIDGRYLKSSGEAVGKQNILFKDTFPAGTGSRSGRSMNIVAGTAVAGWQVPYYERYGIYWPSSTAGDTFEAIDTTATTAGLTHQFVLIRRGIKPAGTSILQADIYTYLELANGDPSGANYRVAMEWGRSIRLDYQDPKDGAWHAVDIQGELPDVQAYLKANNDEITLKVVPDTVRGLMLIEIGQGHWLRHSAPRPTNSTNVNARGALPTRECYRFLGKNGWAQLWITPIRYQPLTVTKSGRGHGEPIQGLGAAIIAPNSLGRNDGSDTFTASAAQDGNNTVTWQATASKPDAGEGLGSAKPPTLSDVFVYVPSQWATAFVFPGPPSSSPVCAAVEELEVFDEVTRTLSSQSRFTCDNHNGAFAGNIGNFAYNLVASNGIDRAQRMRGKIAGGFTTFREDPVRLVEFSGFDNMYTMHVPIGDELIADNWCAYGLAHVLMDLGQIAPQYRTKIPYWPPGPVPDGVYCPYPILGGGTGNRPSYRYQPNQSVISAWMDLVNDIAVPNPSTGSNVPYWTGQDYDGYMRLEPFNPGLLRLSKVYSSNDPSGYGQILEISVYDSIDEMRTELNFQGQDPYTGELLYLHFPMPWNVPYVGYRYAWFERNGRWCSEAYLNQIARSAAILGSLPTQNVHMKVPFDPRMHAGMVVYIEEAFALGRGGFFLITMLRNRYGMADVTGSRGEMESYSWVTARNLETLLPF